MEPMAVYADSQLVKVQRSGHGDLCPEVISLSPQLLPEAQGSSQEGAGRLSEMEVGEIVVKYCFLDKAVALVDHSSYGCPHTHAQHQASQHSVEEGKQTHEAAP